MQTDTKKTEQIKEQIEAFIDGESLSKLIEIVGDICSEKAGHIQENWQDESLAKEWERAANVLHTDSIVSLKDL